jgi:hypothetical protein
VCQTSRKGHRSLGELLRSGIASAETDPTVALQASRSESNGPHCAERDVWKNHPARQRAHTHVGLHEFDDRFRDLKELDRAGETPAGVRNIGQQVAIVLGGPSGHVDRGGWASAATIA